MRLRFLLSLLLALAGCKKTDVAPASGVLLVYSGAAESDVATVDKRLAALELKGAARFANGKLEVRVEGDQASSVKRSLATGGRLELFGVDDSLSKRLCIIAHPDDVKLEKETLRDGTVTCFFSGPPASVRTAAERTLGAALRLQQLPDGTARSFAIYQPAFLTGTSLVEAKLRKSASGAGVSLAFDQTGTRLLAEHTEKLIDMRLAIVFDDLVESAPTVIETIPGGRALLSVPNEDDAKAIAGALQGGALPTLKLETEKTY